MVPLLCSLAVFFIAVHLLTLATAWWRCGPGWRPRAPVPTPPITVVRPLCGLETFSVETIAASFALDYPAYELIFCVARGDDPIVPLVREAMAAHPDFAATLAIGNDPISINPKLNNMVKGWREASHAWITFIDSNVLLPADFLHRLVHAWKPDTGCVAAPPVGTSPEGFGGHLECAFLNTYEARWQYFVDTFGSGFAQGKTLFYRKVDLDRSAMRDLASEPAEDAATTKMVRNLGLRVRLAPPSPQPLGARPFQEVWGRQIRWARLRRATFLFEFLPEILSGSFVPFVTVFAAALALDWNVFATLLTYFGLWYAAEIVMAAACRWPVAWQTPLALLTRDILMPMLWVGAFTGSTFTWKGAALHMEVGRPRDALEPVALQPKGTAGP